MTGFVCVVHKCDRGHISFSKKAFVFGIQKRIKLQNGSIPKSLSLVGSVALGGAPPLFLR